MENTKNTGKAGKFENESYRISILARNLSMTPAIEQHVLSKLSKLEHFADHIIDINVTLELQRGNQTASILMKFLHFQIKVSASTSDLYTAIDKAVEKLVKLIKKYKTKLQSYRLKEQREAAIKVKVVERPSTLEEINDQIDEENLKQEEALYKLHKVVKTEALPLKMLKEEEAIMKLELAGDDFLIYRSEEDQLLKVIYRRKDGDLGIIQIESAV
ncbi:MAG: ribosome-associated translation inhibitor RaiA [Parachlamydiales bacterium]|jgi:putative sigma-54 modulation protein